MSKIKVDVKINEAELKKFANNAIRDKLASDGFEVKCPLCGADMILKAEGSVCPSCGELIKPLVE